VPTEPRQFEDDLRHAVYLRDGYKCAYTGKVDTTYTGKRMSLDHIDPIHTGGAMQNKKDGLDNGRATNLTTAFGRTNSAKGKKSKEAWSAYAKNIAPPKAGLKFEWKEIEDGAKEPLDLKRGAELSKLAKQARDARRLDANGDRTIETPKSKAIAEKSKAIVESYQKEQAAKKAGPGVQHDPKDGRFTSARAAVVAVARDIVRHLRARLWPGHPAA